jgi:hypothetical protein
LLDSFRAWPPEAEVSLCTEAPVGKLICSASREATRGEAAKERMRKKPMRPKAKMKMASWGREKEEGVFKRLLMFGLRFGICVLVSVGGIGYLIVNYA